MASDHAGLGLFYYDEIEHPGFFYAQDKTMELIGAEIRPDKLYPFSAWDNFIEQERKEDEAMVDKVIERWEDIWSGKSKSYHVEYSSHSFAPPKWLTAKAKVTKSDHDGMPLIIMGMLIDITEYKEQRDLIEKQKNELLILSNTDELTGLYNRRNFNHVFEKEFKKATRYKRELSLIMIDIDYFKKVNDLYGHDFGDVVLQSVSKIILSSSRTSDTCCRYGGEKFIVILPETSLEDALIQAERLRATVESKIFNLNYIEIKVTISLGCSSLKSLENKNEQALIKKADSSLYQAKNTGRNKVCS